jgi:hypothetical protein
MNKGNYNSQIEPNHGKPNPDKFMFDDEKADLFIAEMSHLQSKLSGSYEAVSIVGKYL